MIAAAARAQMGRSGLVTSRVVLGSATFGREVDEATASRIIGHYLELGGNVIDTADTYAGGRAEEILGRAIRRRREDVCLVTKAGLPLPPATDRTSSARRHLRRAVEGSLRRLGTEQIDLFLLHRWDGLVPLEETLSTLDDLVRSGHIAHVGASNFTGWQLALAQGTAAEHSWEPLVGMQGRYSLLSREVEREILPYCTFAGIGFQAWQPLAGGVLTGKYQGDAPPEARGYGDKPTAESIRRRLTPRHREVVRVLAEVAADLGRSPTQVALAWILDRPAITSVVVGATSVAQIDEAASVDVRLDRDALARLDAATAISLGYPYDLLTRLDAATPHPVRP